MKLPFLFPSSRKKISELSSYFYDWSEKEYGEFIDGLKKFLDNVSKEAIETKEAAIILRKYVKEGKITQEEEVAFKQQIYDLLKAMGIGIPFVIIPGASVLLPIVVKLAKKYNINIFPSAFNNKNNIQS